MAGGSGADGGSGSGGSGGNVVCSFFRRRACAQQPILLIPLCMCYDHRASLGLQLMSIILGPLADTDNNYNQVREHPAPLFNIEGRSVLKTLPTNIKEGSARERSHGKPNMRQYVREVPGLLTSTD